MKNHPLVQQLGGTSEVSSDPRSKLQVPTRVTATDSDLVSPLGPGNALHWQLYCTSFLKKYLIYEHFKGFLFKILISSDFVLKPLCSLLQAGLHECLMKLNEFLFTILQAKPVFKVSSYPGTRNVSSQKLGFDSSDPFFLLSPNWDCCASTGWPFTLHPPTWLSRAKSQQLLNSLHRSQTLLLSA